MTKTECCFFLNPLQHATQLGEQLASSALGLEAPAAWQALWPVPPSSGGTVHDSPVGLKQKDLVHIDADCLKAVHLESQQKENHQQHSLDQK